MDNRGFSFYPETDLKNGRPASIILPSAPPIIYESPGDSLDQDSSHQYDSQVTTTTFEQEHWQRKIDKLEKRTMKTGKVLTLCYLGAFLIIIAIICLYSLPLVIKHQIHKNMELKPGSESYTLWRDVPIPIYNKFYFFNVTNVPDIELFGSKPNLVEIGPFTYRLKIRKEIINDTKISPDTIEYKEIKTWHFEREMSVADENLQLMSLNAPLVVTLAMLKNANVLIRGSVTIALDAATEGFFIRRSIRELLFTGYPDLLTQFTPIINPSIPRAFHGNFGYYAALNNTDDGIYKIYSGIDDISRVNKLISHNGKKLMKYWRTDECNNVEGSTKGEIRPPLTDETTMIDWFNIELCRVLKLTYRGPIEIDGIRLKRYVLDDNTFKNVTDYPPNLCYMSKYVRPTPAAGSFLASLSRDAISRQISSAALPDILPSGVYDLSSCKYGLPVYLSLPHFLHADRIYIDNITGMEPDEDRHEFGFDVEPNTGSSMRIAARLQINIRISSSSSSFRYRRIPEVMFPVFWQEIETNLPEFLINRLKFAQFALDYGALIGFYIFLGLGCLVLVSAIIYFIFIMYSGFSFCRQIISFTRGHNNVVNDDGTGDHELSSRQVYMIDTPLPNGVSNEVIEGTRNGAFEGFPEIIKNGISRQRF